MKKLILIRHAKSDWSVSTEDMKRPLCDQGILNARLMAKALYPYIKNIDGIFCSPAKRTEETCRIILEGFESFHQNITSVKELYDFEGHKVLSFIQQIPSRVNTAMLFGHNYALTYLVNELGDMPVNNFPTAAMAIIKFDVDNWENIDKGRTEKILTPKLLKIVNELS